ncbi:MAG TPA: c-type cytochrome [Burkholderiales bacterium]
MRAIVFTAAMLAAAPAALADEVVARSLAATCANCHGPDGRSVTQAVKSLAGMPKREIVDTMQAFKAGKKPATVMHQLAKGYSDVQIELIAAHFAALRK